MSLPDIHLNYNFVPMAIIILGSYAIASTFFSVYSMAVDTIFLCFLEDLDKHGLFSCVIDNCLKIFNLDGSQENPYYMNEDLMRILEIKEDKED